MLKEPYQRKQIKLSQIVIPNKLSNDPMPYDDVYKLTPTTIKRYKRILYDLAMYNSIFTITMEKSFRSKIMTMLTPSFLEMSEADRRILIYHIGITTWQIDDFMCLVVLDDRFANTFDRLPNYTLNKQIGANNSMFDKFRMPLIPWKHVVDRVKNQAWFSLHPMISVRSMPPDLIDIIKSFDFHVFEDEPESEDE